MLTVCAHVRSCVCFTSLWCILNWTFKKSSISKYTKLKITHSLPWILSIPPILYNNYPGILWYLLVSWLYLCVCGCSVTCGFLEVASLTWKRLYTIAVCQRSNAGKNEIIRLILIVFVLICFMNKNGYWYISWLYILRLHHYQVNTMQVSVK